MLDLNTVVAAIKADADKDARYEIIRALGRLCIDAVDEAARTAYCSPPVWEFLTDWVIANREQCPEDAFSVESLTDLLETLARACVEVFSYSALPNDQWYPGAPVDLDMHDRGGAIVHRYAYNCAATLCMVANGEQGAKIVKRFDDLQDRNLRKMAELIGKRLGEKLRGR
ncbi:MAG: hypothetical protein V2I43_02590 [Parvularcula sp.]|jgi:hypothetical protein|nr:hypothetical protein [Parvularcula sp.]